jgi:hypothetical protein
MSKENDIGKEALEWWNNLPFNSSNTDISKTHYTNKYFTDRKYNSLTGREIELIYIQVHTCLHCGFIKESPNELCPLCGCTNLKYEDNDVNEILKEDEYNQVKNTLLFISNLTQEALNNYNNVSDINKLKEYLSVIKTAFSQFE